MQEATTADLIFSIPALVAHLSTLMTLEPGDIVATGTPAGVGSARKPRVWLKPGDEIVISSPTLGAPGDDDRLSLLAAPRTAATSTKRQEPDHVEVEPVRRPELDRDHHRRRQRRDLHRGLERRGNSATASASAIAPTRATAAGSRARAPGPRR